jgi:hypothetical protein
MKFLTALAAGLVLLTGIAEAQQPTRTIGQAQRPQLVPSFIVLNAQGAQLTGQKLTLQGISANVIVFTDRPVRAAGHALLAHVLEEWAAASADSFAKEPPSATVSVQSKGKNAVVDAVVVLRSPKLEAGSLVFDVQVLEGDLKGGDGSATVFIDITNVPVAHRTGRHTAWYAGSQ